MTSATFKFPNFVPFPNLSNRYNLNPKSRTKSFLLHNDKYDTVLNLNRNNLKLKLNNNGTNNLRRRRRNSLSVSCCFTAIEKPVDLGPTTTTAASDRLRLLVTEFEALEEPIDRVKRLLDYAARLPPFDDSARSPENRVLGCTTQVWLEARMDEKGRMRFRADSDSEITKGFISCLIWLLDGAEPEEVMAVKAEELTAMNVGLYGKAHSRVNTWNNVLMSMQKRTKALAAEERKKAKFQMEQPPPFVVNSDGISAPATVSMAFRKLDRRKTHS